MEPNRIKEILKKIEAGEPEPLMPTIKKPEPEPVVSKLVAKPAEDERAPKWKITLLAFIVFGLLVMISYGGYLVYQNYKTISGDAPENVIAALSRLTDLPQGEVPQVSTVAEIESLKDQPFFKDAQIGDKVVVFNGAKKAYIYRPSTQKIIGIAPLTQ
jgi:hypothetical protein